MYLYHFQVLAIHNLIIAYQKNQAIIDGFNLSLESGEILAMLGDSGSGKTSILKAVAGLIPIVSGKIILDGVVLNDTKLQVLPEKRGVGMVFQDHALFPHLNVEKNIAFGLGYLNKSQKKQRVDELLSLVELPGIEKKYPHQLSGGEQQRVALVRSLAVKPKVLLMDEPFSNLDASHKIQLVTQMKKILKQEKTTVIMVTHDPAEAAMLADKTIYIANGNAQNSPSPQPELLQPHQAL